MGLLEEIVLAIESLPCNPMAMIYVSSLESDPRSCCVVVAVFSFSMLLNFLGLI